MGMLKNPLRLLLLPSLPHLLLAFQANLQRSLRMLDNLNSQLLGPHHLSRFNNSKLNRRLLKVPTGLARCLLPADGLTFHLLDVLTMG
jgi:hypothetical protein